MLLSLLLLSLLLLLLLPFLPFLVLIKFFLGDLPAVDGVVFFVLPNDDTPNTIYNATLAPTNNTILGSQKQANMWFL